MAGRPLHYARRDTGRIGSASPSPAPPPATWPTFGGLEAVWPIRPPCGRWRFLHLERAHTSRNAGPAGAAIPRSLARPGLTPATGFRPRGLYAALLRGVTSRPAGTRSARKVLPPRPEVSTCSQAATTSGMGQHGLLRLASQGLDHVMRLPGSALGRRIAGGQPCLEFSDLAWRLAVRWPPVVRARRARRGPPSLRGATRTWSHQRASGSRTRGGSGGGARTVVPPTSAGPGLRRLNDPLLVLPDHSQAGARRPCARPSAGRRSLLIERLGGAHKQPGRSTPLSNGVRGDAHLICRGLPAAQLDRGGARGVIAGDRRLSDPPGGGPRAAGPRAPPGGAKIEVARATSAARGSGTGRALDPSASVPA